MERDISTNARRDVRDLTFEAEALGSSGFIMRLRADEGGAIFFQLGPRREEVFALGASMARRELGVIDTLRLTMMLDPTTNALAALGARTGARTFCFFLGADWGQWIDDSGRRYSSDEPIDALRRLRLPIWISPQTFDLTAEFAVNIRNRHLFSRELTRLFQDEMGRHQLALTFALPSGDFKGAKASLQETDSGQRKMTHRVETFPLLWPECIDEERLARAPLARRREAFATGRSRWSSIAEAAQSSLRIETPAAGASPRPGRPARAKLRRLGETDDPAAPSEPDSPIEETVSPLRVNLKARLTEAAADGEKPARARLRPVGGEDDRPVEPTPKALKPIRGTEKLSLEQLFELIELQADEERRWKILEANLMSGRPERVYALIARYGHSIGERTAEWPIARLRTIFRDQPGGILIGIMQAWRLNQVLAVAEGNAEEEKILQWLREHEIDRMMAMDLSKPPSSSEEARRDLKIDRSADAKTIRRVWRTLLGFLNADLGRSNERAIHRKKDEIAKHLQAARNVLLRSMPK